MIKWFESYSNFLQIIIIIAATNSLIMLVQLVLLLIGIGSDSTFDGDAGDIDTDIDVDVDTDVDTDIINDSDFIDFFGLRLFTLRNIIAFFAVGGWSLVLTYDLSNKVWLAIIIGIVAGFITMILVSLFMKVILKLQSNGEIDVKNAVGKDGIVYLRIPKERTGTGKVNVLVQERYCEFEAVTDGEDISTGKAIEVIGVNDGVLVVKVKE